MAGMGIAAAAGAEAAANTLHTILRERFADQLARQQQARADQAVQAQQARLDAATQEDARRWQATDARDTARDTQASAARDAAAQKAQQRQAQIDAVMHDPSVPEPTRRLIELGSMGITNLNVHQLEAPAAHAAHVGAEAKAADDEKFTAWRREQDYSEMLRRTRPVRMTGAKVVTDDPTLPNGVQSYVVQLRSKHPTFEAAAAELSQQLGSLQGAHPKLSPIKTLDALRRAYSGSRPAGGDNLDDVLDNILGGGPGDPGGAVSPAAARGPVPVPPAAAAPAALQDAARAVLQQHGYDTSDASVARFLANPRNRQQLQGGRP